MKRIITVIGLFVILGIIGLSCNKVADAQPVQTEAADSTHKSSNEGTPYLQANSDYTQVIISNPQKVDLNVDDGSTKISLVNGGAQVEKAGEYIIIAAPQVGRLGNFHGFSQFTSG